MPEATSSAILSAVSEPFILDKELYGYELDQRLIASAPRADRDGSRLFVFDTKTGDVRFDVFRNIGAYLPPKSLLVMNETKVVPARVALRKKTGRRVEALFLMNLWKEGSPTVEAMVSRKVRVGDELCLEKDPSFAFKAVSQKEYVFGFETLFSPERLLPMLYAHGETPVPKYIPEGGLTEDALRDRYQTVFAKEAGSVAAPTASLHFTKEVMDSLKAQGHAIEAVTLDIGLGTFASITEENVRKNALHVERYRIGEKAAAAIASARKEGRKVVAVGTTSARALEAYAKTGVRAGETDIFIRPPHEFKSIDCLITNFHVPNSSLMMLVEAFLRHKGSSKRLVDLYRVAMEEGFLFYSFGDSMLIL